MNRTTSIATFLSIVALASFGVGADNSGCQSVDSSAVKTDTIRTNYWLFYKSEDDTTYARAQFRVGSDVGTTLELTDGSKVTFEGQPLAWNELLDWQERKIAGQVKSGSFLYTDNESKTYANKVPASREARVPDAFPAKLPAASSYDFSWQGDALVEGETMEVILAHDANRLQFVAIFERNVGATNVVLSKEDFGKLPRGRTAIAIQRHRDSKLDPDTGAGGKITTTFESPVRIFDLE